MRLKFWKREKKKKIIKEYGQNAYNEMSKGVDPSEFKPKIQGIKADFYIDDDTLASNAMESMDFVHKSYDHKNPIIASADDVFGEENIPDQIKITKGQCMGFLKSGKECSRNVDTVYCWQHSKDRSG